MLIISLDLHSPVVKFISSEKHRFTGIFYN